MIKVKFHAHWRPDDYVQNWISKYTSDGKHWNDLELVSGDDYDYLVIMNMPKAGYKFDKSRAIFLQTEAPSIRKQWGQYNDDMDKSPYFHVYPFPTVFGWSMDISYQELQEKTFDKFSVMSGVISNKNHFYGQKLRLKFVNEVLKKKEFYTAFGRGNGKSTGDKSEGLFPFKYTFNVENQFEKNFITEKLHDGFIAECLTFYDGCPNTEDFYDNDAYIRIDMTDFDKTIDIIEKSIEDNEWEKRLPKIKQMKYKIMNELQPMPLVERIIKEGNL